MFAMTGADRCGDNEFEVTAWAGDNPPVGYGRWIGDFIKRVRADPCDLGGSDLATEPISYAVTAIAGTDVGKLASGTGPAPEPDTNTPLAFLASQPLPGGQVRAGNVIAIEITADDGSSVDSVVTGIASVMLTPDTGAQVDGWEFEGPVACDKSRLRRVAQLEYEVPRKSARADQTRRHRQRLPRKRNHTRSHLPHRRAVDRLHGHRRGDYDRDHDQPGPGSMHDRLGVQSRRFCTPVGRTLWLCRRDRRNTPQLRRPRRAEGFTGDKSRHHRHEDAREHHASLRVPERRSVRNLDAVHAPVAEIALTRSGNLAYGDINVSVTTEVPNNSITQDVSGPNRSRLRRVLTDAPRNKPDRAATTRHLSD